MVVPVISAAMEIAHTTMALETVQFSLLSECF